MKSIYALKDSEGRVHYVGATISPLSERLGKHLTAARIGKRTVVFEWIRSIDFAVKICLLDSVLDCVSDATEDLWIRCFRATGEPLKNVKPGGNGGPFKLTPEQRRKIGESNRRRFSSPEARRIQSERVRAGKLARRK